jgi:sulfur-oxidizing protein SoxY
MHQASPQISLSALGGGEGRGEVGGAPARNDGATHLTLPVARATGPLPLPPQAGGEGDFSPTRRRILLAALGVGLAAFAPTAGATEKAMSEAIRDLIGEAPVASGKIKLELPSIVENGNTVPLTVSVESPMTDADHVESIHIFNQKNPQPYVAAFHLGPRAGKPSVATRIRLADSQRVVAIARLADGSFWSDSADVIVTLAACTEQ